VKKSLIALLVVAAWLLGTALVAFRAQTVAQEALGRARRIVELGEAQKDLMHKEGAELVTACTGKLTPQGTLSIAGYTQKSGTHDPEVFGMLVAVNHRDPQRVTIEEAATFYDPRFGRLFTDALNPFDWNHRLKYARRELQLEETKVIAVSAVWGLVTASKAADGRFDPGEARYYTRVLSFPEGKVLCEGNTTLRMMASIHSTGRAKTQEEADAEAAASAARLIPFVWFRSVVTTPLADLCELAGGKQLCETMAEETGQRR
jgi:hypothetical protein